MPRSYVRRITGLVLAALSLTATTAEAQERTGHVDDSRDQPENLSGPNRPDIRAVSVSYDPSGALTVSVALHQSVYDTQPGYSFHVSVGSSYGTDYDYGTCLTDKPGDVTLSGSIDPAQATPMEMTVNGFEGNLTPKRKISADGGRVDFTVTHSAFASRDYRCATTSELSAYGYPSYGSYGDDTAAEFSLAGYGPPPPPACSDGKDNDGDGDVDWLEDFDCDDASGTSEGLPPPECEDSRDNDGDGQVDWEDEDCWDYDRETPPPPKCSNGIDDDGDGLIDAADSGCVLSGPAGNAEKDRPLCSDGIDNDSDGRMDMRDRECVKRRQQSESRRPRLPHLSRSDARYYTKVALRRKFRSAWVYRYGARIKCRSRGRVRQRCQAAFGIGDTAFTGTVRIRYDWHRKKVWWFWSMNMVRINEYCLAVEGKSWKRCTKRIRIG